MVITAEAGLSLAEENLQLVLSQPQDTDEYRTFVKALRETVEYWRRAAEEAASGENVSDGR